MIARCAWCAGPASAQSPVTGIFSCEMHGPDNKSLDDARLAQQLAWDTRRAERVRRRCDCCGAWRTDVAVAETGALCVQCREDTHREASIALGAVVLRQLQGRPPLARAGARIGGRWG